MMSLEQFLQNSTPYSSTDPKTDGGFGGDSSIDGSLQNMTGCIYTEIEHEKLWKY